MKFETKFISPAMAEALLATNPINRNVALNRVLHYAAQMNGGKWRMNGQGIVVSTKGKLLGGQHRMHAIIKHGKPVEMLIVSDVDEKTFETLDAVKPREAGDALSIRGIIYPKITAAAAATVWRVVVGAQMANTCSATYVEQVYDRFPAFRKWVGHVGAKTGTYTLPSSALFAAIVYLEDIAGRPDLAEDLFKGTVTGEGLEAGSPILALRNRVMAYRAVGGKTSTSTVWPAILQTLNALEDGKPLGQVKIGRDNTHSSMAPKRLAAHLKTLPPPMLLLDLPASPSLSGNARREFTEFVKQLRGTNEVRA